MKFGYNLNLGKTCWRYNIIIELFFRFTIGNNILAVPQLLTRWLRDTVGQHIFTGHD